MIQFVSDIGHYDLVLNLAAQARRALWIGTADIKDLYVRRGEQALPFLAIISELIAGGVKVRLIYAKEPGPQFLKDFSLYPLLAECLERMLCPRVHFKIVLIDSVLCYLGSANFTGAGMGMKSPLHRNFEAGILTDDSSVIASAEEEFDKVWRGSECRLCRRKQYCRHEL